MANFKDIDDERKVVWISIPTQYAFDKMYLELLEIQILDVNNPLSNAVEYKF